MKRYIIFITILLLLLFACDTFDPFDPLPEASPTPTPESIQSKGGILIIITWPLADVTNPSVEGSLLPSAGSAINLSFDLFENTAAYSNSNMDIGDYELSLALNDNTTTLWDNIESVTINKDQISEYNYELQSSDLE